MKEQKETAQEIIVLDEGIDMDSIIGPLTICCFSIFMPFRD